MDEEIKEMKHAKKMDQPSLENIRIVFELLLSPEKENINSSNNLLNQTFNIWQTLNSNLKTVEEKSSSANFEWLKDVIASTIFKSIKRLTPNEIRHVYTQICLQVLIILKNKLNTLSSLKYPTVTDCSEAKCDFDLPAPHDILSIQFENLISKVVQFVICLGIVFNLLPGVGLSIEQRSNLCKFVSLKHEVEESLIKKQQHLFLYVKSLLECTENQFLSHLISSHYLCDILAALLQLSYLPIKSVQNSGSVESSPVILHSLKEAQIESRKYLNEFMVKQNQSSVIRELFVLQGAKPEKQLSQSGFKYISAPSWLRIASTKIITSILLKPNGVLNVISGILNIHFSDDKYEEENPNVIDWHKCSVVSKLIATCPPYMQSKENYYSEIIPQVIQLLHLKHGWNNKLAKISSGIISSFPDNIKEDIFIILTKPLQNCKQKLIYESDCVVLVDEESFSQCIQDLHLMFIIGGEPNSSLLKYIKTFLNILIHVYSFIICSPLLIRFQLCDLLIHLLNSYDDQFIVSLLMGTLNDELLPKELFQWNNMLCVASGSSGGIVVKLKDSEVDWALEDDLKIKCVLKLLNSIKNKKLKLEFFLNLHKHLPTSLYKETIPSNQTASKSSQLLLEIETASENNVHFIRQSLIMCQAIEELSKDDDLLDNLLENQLKAIQFIKDILHRGAELCTNEQSLGNANAESLNLAMSFLAIIIAQEKKTVIINELKRIEPYLLILSTKHNEEFVRNMANELRIAILTDGAIKPNQNSSQQCDSEKDLDTENQKMKVKCEKVAKTRFQQVWFELNDPNPPIRGHALLTIRKLLENKDPETLDNREKIFYVFKENVKHEDSYIYLNAIQGMAAIADKYPDEVIPLLTNEFARKENSPEIRMKIGESLVKTIKFIGDLLPKYKAILLNTFLTGCKDDDSLLRASSLSNLGEVCKGLQFSLGAFIHEILNCVSSILKLDNAVEVKRAAASVLTMILQGLGKNALQVLDTVLRDLYRLLKNTYQQEKDDVVKLHVQLALEELDILTRDFLFPKESLVKKITILDGL